MTEAWLGMESNQWQDGVMWSEVKQCDSYHPVVLYL